jgi:hypothetical protein
MFGERRKGKLGPVMAAMILGMASLLSARSQDTGRTPPVSGVKIGELYETWSKQLSEKRRYRVSLPSSYDESKTDYPLVVVLDGEDYFVPAVGACRFMAMTRLMPEAVVVGVDNSNRRRDMTPPDVALPDVKKGNGDAFLAFLEEELLPVLTSRYRLLPLRILVGHSHGGLIGAYAISARPGLFRWYLLIDAPVGLDGGVSERRLLNYVKGQPRLTGRMISIERSFGWADESWRLLTAEAPRSFAVARIKMPAETHATMFYPALYEGLKWLFQDIMVPDGALATYSEMKKRYDGLSAAYGYRVPLPLSVLMDSAEDQLMAGNPLEASLFVEEAKNKYGASPGTEAFDRWIKVLRTNPLEETSDQILRSSPPSLDQIKPFLGTWVALAQNLSPNRVEITFEVQDAKAVARHREFDESGTEVSPILGGIAYLRMQGTDTIEWGYMNGMRPRTMIIAYAGKIDASGALAGYSTLKGVSFSPERDDDPGRPQPFKFVRRK